MDMSKSKSLSTEQKRLEDLLVQAGVPEKKREALSPVIFQMAIQRAKLEDAAAQLPEEDLTIPFDNGGGQTGVRENPFYKAYIALWRAYLLGMDKIIALLPKEMQEAATDGAEDVLAKVIAMKKAK